MKRLLAILILLVGSPAMAQVQVMPAAKLAECRAMLPKVEDDDWLAFLSDQSTLFYSDVEMPAAYQHAGGGLISNGQFRPLDQLSAMTTFHSPKYNISGDEKGPDFENQKRHGEGGNGNVEFPWRTPGGTDNSEAMTSSFKMLWLPKREDGTPWPVVMWVGNLSGARVGDHTGYKWIFPNNAILGEALSIRDSAGKYHVFELRMRMRRSDSWDIDILRPFPTRKDLAARVREVDPSFQFAAKTELAPGQLVDELHQTVAFKSAAAVDVLPELPEQTVIKLLDTTPFKSALGAEWYEDGGKVAYAPTAPSNGSGFSIVPTRYHATYLHNDTEGCAKCHEHTLKHVDHFSNQRGWYGRIRGSADGIFTFHPIDPSSISYNGGTLPVQLRKSFMDAGIAAWNDPAKHPADRYRQLPEKP